jgi:hypothetical protein
VNDLEWLASIRMNKPEMAKPMSGSRMTVNPEVIPEQAFQRRGPEVGL